MPHKTSNCVLFFVAFIIGYFVRHMHRTIVNLLIVFPVLIVLESSCLKAPTYQCFLSLHICQMTSNLHLITLVKEVMFSVVLICLPVCLSVCLSVCLPVCNITHKVMNRLPYDLEEGVWCGNGKNCMYFNSNKVFLDA